MCTTYILYMGVSSTYTFPVQYVRTYSAVQVERIERTRQGQPSRCVVAEPDKVTGARSGPPGPAQLVRSLDQHHRHPHVYGRTDRPTDRCCAVRTARGPRARGRSRQTRTDGRQPPHATYVRTQTRSLHATSSIVYYTQWTRCVLRRCSPPLKKTKRECDIHQFFLKKYTVQHRHLQCTHSPI